MQVTGTARSAQALLTRIDGTTCRASAAITSQQPGEPVLSLDGGTYTASELVALLDLGRSLVAPRVPTPAPATMPAPEGPAPTARRGKRRR